MDNSKLNKSKVFIASEIAQHKFCNVSWFLQRCGYSLESPKLEKAKVNMPYCKKCYQKLYVQKAGVYHSKNNGDIQKCYCSNCNYKFENTPKTPRPDCPRCNSNKIIGDGKTTNSKSEKVKYWKCKDCNRHFSEVVE